MSILLTLLVYVIVFCLLYWLITILPIPANLPWIKTILIVVLVLAAVILLLGLVGVKI